MIGFMFFSIIIALISALLYLLFFGNDNETNSIKKTIFSNPAPTTHNVLYIFLCNNLSEEVFITIHFPSEYKDFFLNIMKLLKERILSDGYFTNTDKEPPSFPVEIKDGYTVIDKKWNDDKEQWIFLNFIVPDKYSDYFEQIFQEKFAEQKIAKATEIGKISEKKVEESVEGLSTQTIESQNDEQLSDIIDSCNQLNSSSNAQEDVSISIPETSVLSEKDMDSLVAGSEILSEKDYSIIEEQAEIQSSEESNIAQTTEVATEEENISEVGVIEVEEEINDEPEIQEEQTSPVVESSEEISMEEISDEIQSEEIPQEIPGEFTEKAHIEAVDQQTSEVQQENILESIPEELPVEVEEEQQEVLATNECETESTETTPTNDVDKKVTVLAYEYFIKSSVNSGCVFNFGERFKLDTDVKLAKMKEPKIVLKSDNPSDIEVFLKCIREKPIIYIIAGYTFKKVMENVEKGKILIPISFKDQVILFHHEEEVIPGLPIGVYVLEYPD